MKIIRMNLKTLGCWPIKQLGEGIPKYYVIIKHYQLIHFIIVVCLLTLYVKNNFNILTFFELGHSYITILIATVTMVRV